MTDRVAALTDALFEQWVLNHDERCRNEAWPHPPKECWCPPPDVLVAELGEATITERHRHAYD